MDAAAHPAGKAFPVKPVAPPALEPGAKWKALPYKLRKKIEDLPVVSSVLTIVMVVGLVALVAQLRLSTDNTPVQSGETRLLVFLTVTMTSFLLVALFLNFYCYTKYVKPYRAEILDGLRGYVVRWKRRWMEARRCAAVMAGDPALLPDQGKRTVKLWAVDALVFGGLAGLFLGAAMLLDEFHRELDRSTDPPLVGTLPPAQALMVTALLAALVLGGWSVVKLARSVWAWRRWTYYASLRAGRRWWLDFKSSENWKQLSSIRPVGTVRRASVFAVLLALVVILSHFAARMAVDSSVRWSLGNRVSLAACPTECFSWLYVRDFTRQGRDNCVSVTPHLPTLEEYFDGVLPSLFWWTWYSEESYANFMEEQDARSKSMGWTEKTIGPIVARGKADIEELRALSPMGVDEFETLIAPLQADGVKVTRDKDRFAIQAQNLEASIHLKRGDTCRAHVAGGVLSVLQTSKTSESYRSFDLANSVVLLGLIQAAPRTPAKASLHPSGLMLALNLLVIALAWSLLLAPCCFLKSTYDPDREREMQAAAAPATAPFSPPST